jgi:hypothetical protein
MTINEMEAQPAEAPDFSQTPSRHPRWSKEENKFHHPLASAKKKWNK